MHFFLSFFELFFKRIEFSSKKTKCDKTLSLIIINAFIRQSLIVYYGMATENILENSESL